MGMRTEQTEPKPAAALPDPLPMVWDATHYRRMTGAEWRRLQAAKRDRHHDFG